jgi:hypothetical protein
MAAVVNTIPESIRKKAFVSHDDIDILQKQINALKETIGDCFERVKGVNGFVSSTYNQIQQRFETIEAGMEMGMGGDTLDQIVKDVEELKEFKSQANDISEADKEEDAKLMEELDGLKATMNDICSQLDELKKEEAEESVEEVVEPVQKPKPKKVPSDKIFWEKVITKVYSLSKQKYPKNEIGPMLSVWSDFDDDGFWMTVLGIIFRDRKEGLKHEQTAERLDNQYSLMVNPCEEDVIEEKYKKTKAEPEPVNYISEDKARGYTISEPRKLSSSEAFVAALSAGGLEIVDVIEKYVVKDAEGKIFEISRRALEDNKS